MNAEHKPEVKEPPQEPWHLDKRIPIALIVTLGIQTTGMVWWAAALSRQTQEHERRITLLEVADTRQEARARDNEVLLNRVDERIASLIRSIEELKRHIERQYQRQP